MPETRLLKYNEENLARQKQLIEAQRAKDKAEREALKAGNLDTSLNSKHLHKQAGGTSASAYANSGGANMGARGTKRSRESMAEEEEFKNRPEIKLVIPDLLKVKLVDDWEAITKNSQLIPLPRTPSVASLLQDYGNAVMNNTSSTSSNGSASASSSSRSANLTSEVLAGLKLYFDRCIGNNLLYRFERTQYGEMKKRFAPGTEEGGKEGKDMSQVYGVEHLLRLFVNLPELIAHTAMDAETVTVLREALQDVMRWIVQEKDTLFNVSYEETSSAYQNISRQ